MHRLDLFPMNEINLEINQESVSVSVEPRELLIDVLRDRIGLTGTHAGCEQGSCGSCTVLVDGEGVRSCLLFAVQAEGSSITTIEGIGSTESPHPMQKAFSDNYGLQCGFCTPGMVLTAIELLTVNPSPTREEVKEWMSGNLCRCTGYTGIVDSVMSQCENNSGSGEDN